MSQGKPLFGTEEAEILQEVMNIAFGKASAELAEVLDIVINLSVPEVELLRGEDLRRYVADHLKFSDQLSIVQQNFFGRFTGTALLGFPRGADNVILRLMKDGGETHESTLDGPSLLGNEAMLEVGNILIGACIGRLSELLKDYVTYSPPRLVVEDYRKLAGSDLLSGAESVGITMKTMFSFDREEVTGYLFLLTDDSAVEWLRRALHDYLESF